MAVSLNSALIMIAVSGLECYCGEVINGLPIISATGCRADNTCSISETAIGQCSLEKKLSNGLETLRYTCIEVELTQIDSVLALTDICNTSTVSSTETSHVHCCIHNDYCNRDIQMMDKPTSQETLAMSSSTTATPNNGQSKGT